MGVRPGGVGRTGCGLGRLPHRPAVSTPILEVICSLPRMGPANLRATDRSVTGCGEYSRLALRRLPVTPLEQVLGSCLEAFGAEQFEPEGVGEPVGGVEGGADRQRVLDLLG